MLHNLRRLAGTLVATGLVVFMTSSTAFAAQGSIDHVEPTEGQVRVLYSIPGIGQGVTPDVDTVSATIDGQKVQASAALAADSSQGVRRTTVLAIDVSNSMRGERFEEAKLAATTYLETAPLDVFVGIVAFAGDVQVVQEPTLNRAAAIAMLDDLRLTSQTRLYDGIRESVRTAGTQGQRSVLVLSDGGDTSDTPLEEVTRSIAEAKIQVDVVALAQSEGNKRKLSAIAEAGRGALIPADRPAALSKVFETEAAALAKQVLITAVVPTDLSSLEATVEVSIDANDETFTDSAYVTVAAEQRKEETGALAGQAETPIPTTGFAISRTTMLLGLSAAGAGLLFLLLGVLGVLTPRKRESVEERIAAYGRSAAQNGSAITGVQRQHTTSGSSPSIANSALGVAQKALTENKGLEVALGTRLEAAGMSLKPAEWLLLHAGIAFAAGLVGMLLGSIFLALGLFGLGALLPFLFLGMKRSRRLKAFNEQLADTLQLMAGSLSAGLSLAQSADTVVREGREPMTSEFKRALIEARLGVNIEDGLESIAERMQSEDFKWVVMAVRIQRDVGGNLSEVLSQVAATIRERAYLRRQVKTLSAEGRFSAWILGGLPVAILGFLSMTRPGYLTPMIESTLGWVMIAIGCVLMAIGTFWLSKLVKIEV